uniref:AbiU2 domain-containing protein n=2 Tax=Vibrionaceae TaxID=641 RepID=UPI001E4A4216
FSCGGLRCSPLNAALCVHDSFEVHMEEIYKVLSREVTELHYRWTVYREVYAQGEDVTKLLNENGASFFYFVDFLMLDHVALTFSKLTDPNRQGSNDNLSLKQLVVCANDQKNTLLAQELSSDFDTLKLACGKFRLLRNKRIAHADLIHSLGQAKEPLSGFSREYVEEALKLLRLYMNKFESKTFDKPIAYEYLVTPIGAGGSALIEALKLADKHRK